MKRRLLDNRKVYSSVMMLLVIGVVIHLMFVFDPASGGLVADPLALFRVLTSLGFALLVLGVLSETTTLIGVDFFEEGQDKVRFAHYRNVITFKFVIFIVGLLCIVAALLISPSAIADNSWSTLEIIRVGVGVIAGLILVIQIAWSYSKLVRNRADFLEVSRTTIVWYDNEVGSILEVQVAELTSIHTIYEDSPDSPDVEKFELTDASGRKHEINLTTMSLLPQGRKILQIFKAFFPGKTDSDIS